MSKESFRNKQTDLKQNTEVVDILDVEYTASSSKMRVHKRDKNIWEKFKKDKKGTETLG